MQYDIQIFKYSKRDVGMDVKWFLLKTLSFKNVVP